MLLFDQYSTLHSEEKKVLSEIQRKLFLISMLRLGVFCLGAFGVYWFWGNPTGMIASVAVFLLPFFVLVTIHSRIDKQRKFHEALLAVYQTELHALEGNLGGIDNGSAYKEMDNFFAGDIDLFGEKSMFQVLNRTQSKSGEKVLAEYLTENSTDDILLRQESLKELSSLSEWRFLFRAHLSIANSDDQSSPERLIHSFQHHQKFIASFFKYFPIVFSALSLGVMTAYFMDAITWIHLLLWLLIGLGITGPFVKRISGLYEKINKAKSTFDSYSSLLIMLEEQEFQSEALLHHKEKISQSGAQKASVKLHVLSRLLDNLGNRNNILMAPILNGFFLWDLHFAYRIEQWIETHAADAKSWFDTIDAFDALQSLANFVYNHPDYIFAEIDRNSETILKVDKLRHPLMKEEICVPNDIHISDNDFIIITGANMAGKSTFLRSVSLAIVFSNCGLPIPAKQCQYRPIKLISSMRTSDSLQDDTSYFFAELKRLKFIVDALEKERYFVVLDEILKGTNSKDKAEGSKKFVEKLLQSKSTGLIATHDLSLCVLEEEQTHVKNKYFDAEIVNDELHFDYRMKEGVCKNMNASFLLRKMGIVDN